MAKSQKRTTREVRKPKATKTKPAPNAIGISPVMAVTRKPTEKL
ncbi:hypothetical protein [Novosphingobium sp. AP12]|jgi:hypothetical protein|nr:hypothetical protein [Novosphingobium sp. AP12]EJL35267.1 hypothetical protein PMI02_00098 [Novosphingobium sp. AP12]